MSDAEADTPRSQRVKKRSLLSRMAEQRAMSSSSISSLRSSDAPTASKPDKAESDTAVAPLETLGSTQLASNLGHTFNERFRSLTVLSAGSLTEDDQTLPGDSGRSSPFASQLLKGGRDDPIGIATNPSDESEQDKASSALKMRSGDILGGEDEPKLSSGSPVLNSKPMPYPRSWTHGRTSPDPLNSSRRLFRLEQRAEMSLQRSASSEAVSRYSSASCPTPLSATVARSQGFLIGAMSGVGGAMLGAEELEKVFPERRLTVMCVTWNMAFLKPSEYPTSLETLLYPSTLDFLPDIYAIGIQEIAPENPFGNGGECRREWVLRIQATLGPNFIPFESVSMGTLHLSVFLRRDLIWFVSIPETASVNTRAAIATKGAVGLNVSIFGTSFLFINSHFKADDGNLKMRIDDYSKVIANLALPKRVIHNEHLLQTPSVTSRFDVVLWMGDLNFRIERPRQIVERVLNAIRDGEHPNYEDLLAGDELLQARAEGKCFQDFDEGRINFAPTYKFDLQSDVYDTSGKMRIPSYTDRIMYRARRKGTVTCLEYESIPDMKYSDHRPVFARFEVDLKPGQDNIPLAAGAFQREIYVEGNRRRALRLDLDALKTEKSNSRVCVLQ